MERDPPTRDNMSPCKQALMPYACLRQLLKIYHQAPFAQNSSQPLVRAYRVSFSSLMLWEFVRNKILSFDFESKACWSN